MAQRGVLAAVVLLVVVVSSCGAGSSPGQTYLLNLTAIDVDSLPRADFYETMHLITAVAGLVNRAGPRLYSIYTPADTQWLGYLQQPGQLLHNATLLPITSVQHLLQTFHAEVAPKGAVVYDGVEVPATAALASTAAGAENLLPFCRRSGNSTHPSLYDLYVASGAIEVALELKASMFPGNVSGTRKGDAYRWAIERWIKSGVCSPQHMGFYIDYYWVQSHPCCGSHAVDYQQSTLPNQDYVISKGGFFWDLDVWPDEAAADEPTQPVGSDLLVLQDVLAAANVALRGETMIHITGFTPWSYKYVKPFGKHPGVATEWQTVKVTTSFNAVLDADACCIAVMANAAFYTHSPLQERYQPHPLPTRAALQAQGAIDANGKVANKTFGFWYAGDYDAAAWLYSQLRQKWDDPARGTVPIGWAVDSELSLRFPVIFDYLYSTRTPMDFFITGDSGAGGYINPSELLEPRYSNLTSGAATWRKWAEPYYVRFGLSFSGFLINGNEKMTPEANALFKDLSPVGVVEQRNQLTSATLFNGTLPIIPQAMDVTEPDPVKAAQDMCAFKSSSPHFLMFRAILKTATFMSEIAQHINATCGAGLEIVDPRAVGLLARLHFGAAPTALFSYLSDTFPRRVRSQATVRANFTLRTEWDDVAASAETFLAVSLACPSAQPSSTNIPVGQRLLAGAPFTVSTEIVFPTLAAAEVCELVYQMVVAGVPAEGLGYRVAIAGVAA